MKNDVRLQKFIDKRLVVTKDDHPWYGEVGTGREIEECVGTGFGLRVEYDHGEEGFIFDRGHIQHLIRPTEAELTQEEIIEMMAGCNYTPEYIARYLEMDEAKFMVKWYDHHSPIRISYDKGKLQSEFAINKSLLQNAEKGNITSAQLFFKKHDETNAHNLKKEIFR